MIGFEGLGGNGDNFLTVNLTRKFIKVFILKILFNEFLFQVGICKARSDEEKGPKYNFNKKKQYDEDDDDYSGDDEKY